MAGRRRDAEGQTIVKTVLGLLSLFLDIYRLWKEWSMRKTAREAVAAEVAKEEARLQQKTAEVMAERRDLDDVARRLRDGSF
jgi:hypothetical protein